MEAGDLFVTATCFLGFLSLSKVFINLLKWVWAMFLRPTKNLKDYGSWAIITGSTDGIGKALACDFAAKGLNLVLVGRDPQKLEATLKEIRGSHGKQVDVRIIVLDFEKVSKEEIAEKIEEGILGLDIGILVNNAGMAYPYPKFFHEVDTKLIDGILKVNIEGVSWVTKAVLPLMMKKRKGAIINIGSGSSVVVPSYPLWTVYAATKGYISMFSRCIHLEYKRQGIDVQCQIPLFVATKMSKLRASPFIPSPEAYSKASLRSIGYEHLSLPYWLHSLQWWFLKALPDALLNKYMMQYFLQIRKKMLLKEKKVFNEQTIHKY